MRTVLFIIGVILIGWGTFGILYTERMRKGLAALTGKLPTKALAVVPIVFGGLLLVAAPWSKSVWLVGALGLLAVAKGVLLLILPKERSERIITWWRERASEVVWRLWGLIAVILGIFLFVRT